MPPCPAQAALTALPRRPSIHGNCNSPFPRCQVESCELRAELARYEEHLSPFKSPRGNTTSKNSPALSSLPSLPSLSLPTSVLSSAHAVQCSPSSSSSPSPIPSRDPTSPIRPRPSRRPHHPLPRSADPFPFPFTGNQPRLSFWFASVTVTGGWACMACMSNPCHAHFTSPINRRPARSITTGNRWNIPSFSDLFSSERSIFCPPLPVVALRR